MSRRCHSTGDSSLELLLDTICNTFGGVLFLAMLVSLLLAQTRRRSAADDASADPRPALTPAELARLDTLAHQLSDDVARLERAVSRARETVADFSVSGIEAAEGRLEQTEQERDSLQAERVRILTDLAAAQAAAARAKAATTANSRDAQQAESQMAAARARLDAALDSRQELVRSAVELRDAESQRATVQTTGRAPRERETSKQEFGVMLRYGRLYLMKVLRGGDLVVNDEEFFVEVGADHNVARPKPHAGLDLRKGDVLEQSLAGHLATFPAASWYPCLVVHPDSFDDFVVLKTHLVARGYEYRVLPTADGVLDRGGEGAVQ